MLFGGILLILFAIMLLEMTARTIFLYVNRDQYVSTEFILDELIPDEDGPRMVGRVALTNEEIFTQNVAHELYTFDSPSAVIGRLPPPETVKGRRLPIWYNPNGKKFLWDARVVFLSEWGELPRMGTILRIVAVQAALAAIGVICVLRGAKRMRQSNQSNTPSPEEQPSAGSP